jgi:hypothetical protein
MFCLFDMIYICGINELENLNLNNFSSIINCSLQLNNSFTSQNVINANLNKPINFMISDIIQILEYIYNCCSLGKKIIIVDENGIDNSMFIAIMFLMKYYKKKFEEIYSSIILYKNIHPKEYYNSINLIEYYLINNFSNLNNNLVLPTTYSIKLFN